MDWHDIILNLTKLWSIDQTHMAGAWSRSAVECAELWAIGGPIRGKAHCDGRTERKYGGRNP